MESQKVTITVTPAKAGVHNWIKKLDSGLRRNDGQSRSRALYKSTGFRGAIIGGGHSIFKGFMDKQVDRLKVEGGKAYKSL
jgi:hypothetical protein